MPYYADIFEAIKSNDIEAVKTFLPEQLEARDGNNRTPLQLACWIGHTEIARLLLDNNANVDARYSIGTTSLHYAVQSGHSNTVCLLLDYDADINARDKYGVTPLHMAGLWNKLYMSELLVSRGADPFIKDKEGKTPLDYDSEIVIDKDGNEVPHREILLRLRTEYINKRALDAAETTAALSSGWEMEM